MGLYADSPYWSALLIHIIYSECFPSEPLGLVLMKSFVGSGGPKKYQKCFFLGGGGVGVGDGFGKNFIYSYVLFYT